MKKNAALLDVDSSDRRKVQPIDIDGRKVQPEDVDRRKVQRKFKNKKSSFSELKS